jgi:hypothetical protein
LQVLFLAEAKSSSAAPTVNTAMLPTFVPVPMVNGKETAALADPSACEPMFTLGLFPLNVTCARATVGGNRKTTARRNEPGCIRRDRS